MKLTATLAICYCVIVFSACKKSDDNNVTNNNNNNNNPTTQKQILEAGKWQLSAYTGTVNYMGKDTTIDLYGETEECDKDDFILFASNGTGTADEGANKCADDSQIENFTWALLNNDTKLYVADSNPDTMDIVELTATQMKLKMNKMSGTNAVAYVHTYKNIK